MNEDSDIIPVSQVRIVPTTSNSSTDALYSDSLDANTEKPDAPFLTPVFLHFDTQKESQEKQPESQSPRKPDKGDSVSTGTFGNLVKKASQNSPIEDRAAEARQRIRFNLRKVGPRRRAADRCEAWREYLF